MIVLQHFPIAVCHWRCNRNGAYVSNDLKVSYQSIKVLLPSRWGKKKKIKWTQVAIKMFVILFILVSGKCLVALVVYSREGGRRGGVGEERKGAKKVYLYYSFDFYNLTENELVLKLLLSLLLGFSEHRRKQTINWGEERSRIRKEQK